MTALSLVKTYTFSVNNTLPTSGVLLTDNRNLMLKLKQLMVVAGGVVQSSSAGAGSYSAADNWGSDITKLVWNNAGSNHSWIVIRFASISSTYEVCLSCGTASSYNATIVWSQGGFSGGSATARPTATDEKILVSTSTWGGNNSTSKSYVMHCMYSTDGQVVRIITYENNLPVMYYAFEKAQNPKSGWTTPSVCSVLATSSGASCMTSALLFGGVYGYGYASATSMPLYLGTESYAGNSHLGANIGVPNDFDTTYPCTPCSFVSTTSPVRGRHGTAFDLWGGNAANAQGTYYPSGASKAYVQCGSLVLPWDGSTILLA